MEATARLSYLHISPRKVRLAAHVLKGMDVRRAELELHNLPKRASMPLVKLLKSAIQNAVHDLQQDPARLYVKSITVDAGPVAKRMMPRAFGRGATIRKRTSHVSLVLGLRGEERTSVRKTKKGTTFAVREADWEDVKGNVVENRPSTRNASAGSSKKKSGKFSKKIFTRKVI